MDAVILLNSGGGSAGDDPRGRVARALAAAGIGGEVELVAGERLAGRAAAAVAGGAKLVIAAGGDGSVSAVAGALAGSEAALGILPLGTLNHLARDLGLPLELDQAAEAIAAGPRRRIDVAELNGRVFVNNSAIGLYPLMVADREGQQRLGRSKRLAMLVAAARALVRFHHHRLVLTINDGERHSVETPLLFVGNNDYSLSMPGAGERQRIDDGRLCVVVLRSSGRLALLAAIARALVGRPRAGDLERIDHVTRLRVASRRSRLTVSADGETLRLVPPLDYSIRPAALWVIAPAAAPLKSSASRAPRRRASSTASSRSRPRSAPRSQRG